MKKVGIFYGTTTGTTNGIVDEVDFFLRKEDHEIINVANGIEKINEFENLIFITPTYGVGELQVHWLKAVSDLEKIDFTGKVVGLIGLGNQYAFGESFVGALKPLYDIIIKNGGKVVGFTSTEGYHYEESEAIIEDQFIGLALDETNQADYTPERIQNWITEVKAVFN